MSSYINSSINQWTDSYFLWSKQVIENKNCKHNFVESAGASEFLLRRDRLPVSGTVCVCVWNIVRFGVYWG